MNKKRTGIISVLISGILPVMRGVLGRKVERVARLNAGTGVRWLRIQKPPRIVIFMSIKYWQERFIHISESILLHRMWY